MITVLYFGRLSDVAKSGEMPLPRDVKTVADLSAHLCTDNAALSEALARDGNRAAVNTVMVGFDASITEGDEIAFMSPLSGG